MVLETVKPAVQWACGEVLTVLVCVGKTLAGKGPGDWKSRRP